ncbi:MAG: tRNA pseudouridine(38-40) synthase TruA [Mariniblastus sp.]|nr:tRNA pseudouridine(38-40) synthase TruA [Mariniblastus sp.]
MRHLKLKIAYDGTDYVGWQVQHNGVSIQQRLEEGWTAVTGETTRITASGRTDSGVHALAQVCSVATESQLTPETLVRALNAETPYDVAVLKVEEAPDDFHAIRDAIQKTYCYYVQYGRIQNPLRLRTCWYVPGDIDIQAMQEAAIHLTGELDFASFQTTGAERNTTIRNVSQLEIEPEPMDGFPGLKITITANGFLYNMVRNIVGTLIRVGKNSNDAQWVKWVLDQQDRQVAGQTAPAHALYLHHVV